ncbi:MAG: Transcription factor Sox-2 [Bogoriella megaspora]|nr:MAG: Transcription factor Sox-2 [Bogoriella megaspora]
MEQTPVHANAAQLQPTKYDAGRQDLVERVWRECLAQISSGQPKLTINDEILVCCGKDSLEDISSRYKAVIHAEVAATHMPAEKQIIIAATYVALAPSVPPTVASNPQPASRNARRAKDKVARPPNAFILYRQHHHPKVREKLPDMHNNDISKLLGNQWKGEDEAVRAEWKAKAEKAKADHSKAHPDYQYQPRKPSEKKKRWTKAKAAAAMAKMQTEQESAGNTVYRFPLQDRSSGATVEDLSCDGPISHEPLPAHIPHFTTSEEGARITQELFPGERHLFEQTAAQHNSAYLSANPNVAADEIPFFGTDDQVSLATSKTSDNFYAGAYAQADLGGLEGTLEMQDSLANSMFRGEYMPQANHEALRQDIFDMDVAAAEAERQVGLSQTMTDELPSTMMGVEPIDFDWSEFVNTDA